jgi:hypothetical protein
MAKVIIQIEDNNDEIVVQCAIEPPLTEDKTVFSTAEIVGLYLREHLADILKSAVTWSQSPEEAPTINEPKLILPN